MTIAEQFAEAFNQRNVDALLACFTEDATYADLLLGEVAGHKALGALFERMMHEIAEVDWNLERVVPSDTVEMAEWTFRIVVSDALPRNAGRTMSLRGMSVFEVRDGRCCAYREYFDRGSALVQLGLDPQALHHVLSREQSTVSR